jgi:hypothetical protein
MKTFIEYCQKTKKQLPIFSEKTTRSGIMNWAYPDGYIRSHYPAQYFTPISSDAIQKMGDKTDDDKVDHGS